jgi:hypothetical protein
MYPKENAETNRGYTKRLLEKQIYSPKEQVSLDIG